MNDNSSHAIHWSFWLTGVLLLIWNVMGAANYLGQMNAEFVASLPENHQTIINNRPAWATGGFAIAVFGGALGCLLLLLRKSMAFYFLALSLLGVIVTMIHTFSVANSGAGFSVFELGIMVIMPLLVAVFLLWYAKYAESKAWLR